MRTFFKPANELSQGEADRFTKQRFAHEIVSYFPANYGTYYEPFIGSGSVLATLRPQRAVANSFQSEFGTLPEGIRCAVARQRLNQLQYCVVAREATQVDRHFLPAVRSRRIGDLLIDQDKVPRRDGQPPWLTLMISDPQPKSLFSTGDETNASRCQMRTRR